MRIGAYTQITDKKKISGEIWADSKLALQARWSRGAEYSPGRFVEWDISFTTRVSGSLELGGKKLLDHLVKSCGIVKQRARRQIVHAETSADIDATPADVWKVLTDVERMPTWTESVSKAECLNASELAVGTKVRLKQPRLGAMVWKVTELEPGASFTWTTSRGGVTTTAGHQLRANEPGNTTIVLSIDQRGPMASIASLFTSKLIAKYLAMEAEGLKRWCESQ